MRSVVSLILLLCVMSSGRSDVADLFLPCAFCAHSPSRSEIEYLQTVTQMQAVSLTGGYLSLANQVSFFLSQVDQQLNVEKKTDTGDPLWFAWGQVLGGKGSFPRTENLSGYQSYSSGVSGGIDRTLEDWRLGFAINEWQTIMNWGAYNAKTQPKGLAAVFYGSYSMNSWNMNWQLGGGGNRVENNRDTKVLNTRVSDRVISKSNIGFYTSLIKVGYEFHYRAINFSPGVAFYYMRSFNKDYREYGSERFNLFIPSNTQNNLDPILSFDLSYNTAIFLKPAEFHGNIAFAYELMDQITTLEAGFLDFPLFPLFDVNSPNVSRFDIFLEAGFDVSLGKNARLGVDYMLDFRPYLFNNGGALALKIVF